MSVWKGRYFMLDAKKAIKHLTIDRGIKINELAERIGSKPHALSNWLYRPDVPKINTVEEILKELGCHLAIVDDETGKILF